jgi:hypothetical protein
MSSPVRYVAIGLVVIALAALGWHRPGEHVGAAPAGTPAPADCASLIERGTPLVAASPSAATPIAAAHTAPADREGLIAALEARNVRVESEEAIQQPFFNAERITRLVVTGGPLSEPAELQVYEYTDPAALATDASQVAPDGNLRTVMIEWVAAPHFFCGERLIVIYLGDDQAAIDLLTDLLGPQFAGR